MSQEEVKHSSVNGEPSVTVETTQEYAGPARPPSLELRQSSDTTAEDKGHHKQSSLASLAIEEELPASGDRTESRSPSPSDTNDFKSSELHSVALEELSLDDTAPRKPTPLSLVHAYVSRREEDTEDTLATAKPPPEDDGSVGLSPKAASTTSALSLDALLSPVRASTFPSEDPRKEVETEEEEEDITTSPRAETAGSPITNLDDLLSPKKDSEFKFPIRESVTASDFTDDEARFSTVLLSARQSLDPAHVSPSLGTALSEKLNETLAELPEESHEEAETAAHDDRRDTLDGNAIVRLVHQNRVHKKTASTSTIHSANNVPFILARLEGEEGSRRTSQDGKQKLQEEFEKKQGAEETENAETSVDWGE